MASAHSMENELKPGGLTAWLVCPSAGFFFFYEFFQLNLFDVINPSLRVDFHIDATKISLMSSMYVWANILFLIPAGVILDRFSVKRVVLMAMMICMIATIGFGVSQSFLVASFFRFLTGIGNAFCFLSCVVLASRWFPPRRQAFVIGCLVTMAFLGGMAAHAPFAYLVSTVEWRLAMMVNGCIGGVLLCAMAWMIQDKPQSAQLKTHSMAPLFLTLKEAMCNRETWLCGLYTSCLNLPIMVLGALWGGSYLVTVHHVSALSASHIVGFLFIGSMVGCPVIGLLSDSLGLRKPPMVMGAVLTLFAILPLFLGLECSKTLLCAVFFTIGFFSSAQVISYPCIAESHRPESVGSAMGIASVVVMSGGGISQIIFGQLLQYHAGLSAYVPSDYQFALGLFPVAVMIALFVSTLIRETYCLQTRNSHADC